MFALIAIGLGAGVITAVSPCILPVLPIVLAGSVAGASRRRPFLIVGGLVASFTVFTLAATWLLSSLGLPQDILRNLAIALLFVLAATLLFPRLAIRLERPLAFMTRRPHGHPAGGFLLGVSLGLVFVPCAGPVLAAVTALSAEHRIGFDTVVLTLAYAVGAGLPLLAIALGGQRAARGLRAGSERFRQAMGVVLTLAAVAITLNLDQTLQTHLGGYTSALQQHVEETKTATKQLRRLTGAGDAFTAPVATSPVGGLPELGPAPAFAGISSWLNTPGDRPLTLAGLRGKVVLVDFWTYSCINCIRTLPHLRAWYAAYHRDGLEIVGVHTPEFAFEHVRSNVRTATHDLHVTWPVALDNDYKTWNAYSNQYWPAEYLIDRTGLVRHTQFGEGDYDGTERAIRTLLGAPATAEPAHVTDAMPDALITPETYLGYSRLDVTRYSGDLPRHNRVAVYSFPSSLSQDDISIAGAWRLTGQRAVAVRAARLRIHFHARDVYLVLGGRGTVTPVLHGRARQSIRVAEDRLYTLVQGRTVQDAVLELRFSPGVDAYAFTFG